MGFSSLRDPEVGGGFRAPVDIKCIHKHRKLVPVPAERTIAVIGSSYSRFLFPVMKMVEGNGESNPPSFDI